MGWHENQDSSLVERQARDLEVRVRVPVQVTFFKNVMMLMYKGTNYKVFFPFII